MNNLLKFLGLYALTPFAIVFLSLGVMFYLVPQQQVQTNEGFQAGSSIRPINNVGTNDNAWVGSDIATDVLPSNGGRRYAVISNITGATSTSNNVWCSLGEDAVLYEGVLISASSTYELDENNLDTNRVSCITENASGTVSVIEK